MSVYISEHPLIKHKVSLVRQASLGVKEFRSLTKEITSMLMVEATKSLTVSKQPITTWSGELAAPILAEKQPTLVPILRAGLGMLDGALAILPCAKISVVGIKRNEDTLQPQSYYDNIVADIEHRQAIVIDPMLATGGTAIATVKLLKSSGCNNISAVFMVAAPEGIAALSQAHPDVNIYSASLDQCLNQQGYILPGLGDAGDKIFGTL